jgi:ComF family protein
VVTNYLQHKKYNMQLVEKLIALYAPHLCVGCNAEGYILCPDCRSQNALPVPRCYHCHEPSRLGRTCRTCRLDSPLVSVNAATTYDGYAKDVLWSLKFGRAQAAASIIAAMMAECYGELLRPDTLIMPVPTATKRVRNRGYDQALLIARAFAERSNCRYAPLLVRHGAQEQKQADRQQRHSQLQGAFSLRQPDRIHDARILLVDDVLTTGATLEEAALTLRNAGARVVGGLVFARV